MKNIRSKVLAVLILIISIVYVALRYLDITGGVTSDFLSTLLICLTSIIVFVSRIASTKYPTLTFNLFYVLIICCYIGLFIYSFEEKRSDELKKIEIMNYFNQS